MAARDVEVYDTTLRDGAQQEGMNLSVADKMAIAPLLDELGVDVIEGGWPGAVPKDTEFFALAHKELEFAHATFAAFGATRKAGTTAAKDPQVRALLDSEAPIITLVAKSDIRHVERALKTTADENLAMIADTVAFLACHDRRVLVDAEHFFQGYRVRRRVRRPCASRRPPTRAPRTVVLCDTNGGMLPDDVSAHRRRGGEGDQRADRDARPQRLGLRRREHHGSCRGGRDARAGVRQRVRRAHGQRGPGGRRGEPRDQARPRRAQGERPRRGDAHRPRDSGDHEHRAVRASAVRRSLGLRAQGGTPRVGHPRRPGPVPAHAARARRKRHAHGRVGDGGSRVGRAQGQGAGLRPQGPDRAAGPRHRPREERRGAGLHVRRRRRVVRAPVAHRDGRRAVVLGDGGLARARPDRAVGPDGRGRRGDGQAGGRRDVRVRARARETAPSTPSTTRYEPPSLAPTRRSSGSSSRTSRCASWTPRTARTPSRASSSARSTPRPGRRGARSAWGRT